MYDDNSLFGTVFLIVVIIIIFSTCCSFCKKKANNGIVYSRNTEGVPAPQIIPSAVPYPPQQVVQSYTIQTSTPNYNYTAPGGPYIQTITTPYPPTIYQSTVPTSSPGGPVAAPPYVPPLEQPPSYLEAVAKATHEYTKQAPYNPNFQNS